MNVEIDNNPEKRISPTAAHVEDTSALFC